ncbi:MAG: hypothetical protein L6416_10605 [Candidatus Omnitrophica bacterium]|nr:hypothetical protein [Candidatus Omnitrophota bacterium]
MMNKFYAQHQSSRQRMAGPANARHVFGAAYKIIYEKSNDREMLRLSNEAFDKASLLTTQKGGAKRTGAGLFF